MLFGRERASWHTPFSLIEEMQREMNQVFTRVFGEGGQLPTPWTGASTGSAPQIESWVKDKQLYLKADLPGIDPQDVEVTVEGNRLTLRGERKAEHEEQDRHYLYREARYGSFERTVVIPEGIKAEDVHAQYRNGVLELTMPLPASMVPKKVQIAIADHQSEQKQISAA